MPTANDFGSSGIMTSLTHQLRIFAKSGQNICKIKTVSIDNIFCNGQRKNQLNSFNAGCSMPIICRCLMGHRRLVNASGQPEIIAALFILINGIITLGHLCAQL